VKWYVVCPCKFAVLRWVARGTYGFELCVILVVVVVEEELCC
jgi:hypothetical protein